MDKQKCIAKVAQNEDDYILFAHIYDRLVGAEQKNIPAYTQFLSPREQVLTSKMLAPMEIHFFGGSVQAERAICYWIPDYLDQTWIEEEKPVACIRTSFYEKDRLTHRDFLGGLMGIGIERHTIGDIFPAEGKCDFFVTREMLPYVLDNFLTVGRTKLHLEEIPLAAAMTPEINVKQINTTVASLRLDSVLGSGIGLSRGRSVELISSGRVSVNDLPCMKPDCLLEEGDKVSARGFGKLLLSHIGNRTKKDRISITIERYL